MSRFAIEGGREERAQSVISASLTSSFPPSFARQTDKQRISFPYTSTCIHSTIQYISRIIFCCVFFSCLNNNSHLYTVLDGFTSSTFIQRLSSTIWLHNLLIANVVWFVFQFWMGKVTENALNSRPSYENCTGMEDVLAIALDSRWAMSDGCAGMSTVADETMSAFQTQLTRSTLTSTWRSSATGPLPLNYGRMK